MLLAVYALDMAAPLFVLAALWDRFDLGHRRWLRGRMLSLGPVRVHTTSLISGLLFVIIGVLFLRFDGTAGMTRFLGMGDTSDLEFAAQERITAWATLVPAGAFPATIALVAGLWAVRRARSSPGRAYQEPDIDDVEAKVG